MSDELAEFPFEDSALLDALVTADLTTGPAGQRLTYDERNPKTACLNGVNARRPRGVRRRRRSAASSRVR